MPRRAAHDTGRAVLVVRPPDPAGTGRAAGDGVVLADDAGRPMIVLILTAIGLIGVTVGGFVASIAIAESERHRMMRDITRPRQHVEVRRRPYDWERE